MAVEVGWWRCVLLMLGIDLAPVGHQGDSEPRWALLHNLDLQEAFRLCSSAHLGSESPWCPTRAISKLALCAVDFGHRSGPCGAPANFDHLLTAAIDACAESNQEAPLVQVSVVAHLPTCAVGCGWVVDG